MKDFLVLLTYRLLFVLLTPLLVLAFLLRSRSQPAYRQRLLQRFGWLSSTMRRHSIVIHAASVGEVIAIKAFVASLLQQPAQTPVTITTFTPTGSAQVQKQFAKELAAGTIQHCYLPLDCYFACARFLDRLQPQAMVFMETELWPNLLAQCTKRHIPLLLINGRLSEKSLRHYGKLRCLIAPALRRFDSILTQSEQHQQRYLQLGATPEHCQVSGNLKFDINASAALLAKQQQLATQLIGTRPVWLVASTHPGDDELALAALKQLKNQWPELLLLLVPRHPERFARVADLIDGAGFQCCRRSDNTPVPATADVWLLDTLGELSAAFGIADVVTMGGTFSNIGGHNPLEAALFSKAIVVGADMANFGAVLQQLQQAQGIISLTGQHDVVTELTQTVAALLAKPEQRAQLGSNAYQVVLANQGASNKSADILRQLLHSKS